MIKIGTLVSFVPSFLDSDKFTPKKRKEVTVTGIITYINWAHHYFTVQWSKEGCTWRESFKFFDIGRTVKICGRH